MNIILLSGGSGKRLWPLSNGSRSKQFIKLLKNDSGDNESMVQRVYRSISAVDKYADITVATNELQVSSIKKQLGDGVSVCVEPNTRDTFPAIALSVAYLRDVKHLSDDDCVIVCPVDPYADDSYYRALKRMADISAEGSAALTLMGVQPTYPSEKYGYVFPKTNQEVSNVKYFKEKPNVEKAKEYISKGALWNAGIFAFKLGYMLDKVQQMVGYKNYHDLLHNYDDLPAISFDYAVVEKEHSIRMMRYSGEWKDVGTWNTMSEVMTDKTIGNVIMDDTCVNTNVINELDIPILCMGCKDMVVALSGDGLLVSDKEHSAYMKPYVDKIDEKARFLEKSWGTYTVIDALPNALTAKIFISKDHSMKYHSHEFRSESWHIVRGSGRAIVNGNERKVRECDVITIAPGVKHTLIADTDMTVIEVQVGSEISSKDKIIHDCVE